MERQVVGRELEPLLIELVDLALTAKQAHWNVSGMWFRQLHAQLDDLADVVRLWSDDVAERLTTVGVAADARVETVAATVLRDNLCRFEDLPVVARVPSLPALAPATRVLLDVSHIDLLDLDYRCEFRSLADEDAKAFLFNEVRV